MKKNKAVIIGAGIGGLATAIQLAQKGFEVSIFEKNATPGGRCQLIKKDGHIFDTGPTMFIFPDIYENFFASIGEDMHRHLKLLKADPIYQLNFADQDHLILTSNLQKMHDQFESLEPGSFEKFKAYLEVAKLQYNVAMNTMIMKSLSSPLDFFNLKNLFLMLKSHSLINHCTYAKQFFSHPNLIAACTFQDSYLSLNPFQSPSIYSIFSYSEMTNGSYLPIGGMYQVILALEKIAKKHHITIQYNAPVEQILIKESRAVGIKLHNKDIAADIVIANSDLTHTYTNLLPTEPYTKKLLKKKYSCSALTFHWGLDKTFPQLQTHNLFFSEDYKQGFDQVINKKDPPLHPHFYIQAPSRTDSSRAPKDQDTLSVMIPINHLYPDNPVDWEAYAKTARKYVIQRLHKAGLKHIEKHIKFEIMHKPSEWKEFLNLTYGAVYGLHHDLMQLGYLRPKRQHSKYKNLFFVGASNHPGSGLPTVLLSSRFTSEAIMNSLQG